MAFSESVFAYQLFIKKNLIREKSRELLLEYAYVSAYSYLYKKELYGLKTLKEEKES